ncbi:hypothetical protein BKP37_07805 [Anaerobacillus alkalilacustris]|uniref:histidine kinase n=1 Tax=Anaerobacillus alkalilacustris TaxID=393763 RepID=A0A1S2LQ73_9BACI|nr:HAMP domain-containing sensor histidine kinase [Anaerobacillus alkalilacustris]OIJ14659.1 hypothetical protein BKP37_07805 [Anaerobacillus alkalilacustris]
MKKRKVSIFMKLFFTYLISSFAAFILFSFIFYLLFNNNLKQSFLDSMETQQEQVVQILELAYQEENKEAIISTLNIINDQEHRSIFIYDENGQLLYRFSTLQEPIHIEEEMVQKALQGTSVKEFIKEKANPLFIMASPIETNEFDFDEKVVVIALHNYFGVVNGIKGLFLLAGAITIVVTTLFLYTLSKKITAPLREMNHVAMEYAKGDFTNKVKIKSQDEIGQLGKTFNYMANELSSLDLMRKEFVANVSHDMRSPLTSINGFVGALLDGTIPKNQQKRYLYLMKDETERLIKLVNDLLDIARIEAGQVSIQPINYNLSEQIRKLIAKMEPELIKHNIDIEFQGNLDEDIEVYADPNRMDQVFGNLLQNAVNFSPENGLVTIGINELNHNVMVIIKDEGTGIKKEELKYIWDRFFKVDKARSKKGGTGIGLSIVKHIIDLHQAKIDVKSEVGVGTTFCVTLPKFSLKK